MKANLKMILAVIAVIMTVAIYYVVFQPYGESFCKWEVTNIQENSHRIVELPMTEIIDMAGMYTFSTNFTGDVGYDALSITRILGYGFQVELNNQLIFELGDMDNYNTANIWNGSYLVKFPKDIIKEVNDITITVLGVHDVGFPIEPTLVNYHQASLINDIRNMLTAYLSYVTIGISFVLGALLLILATKFKNINNYYKQIGLSCMLYGVYCYDYAYRLYNGNIEQMLMIRKVLFIAIILCAYFMLKGLKGMATDGEIKFWIKALFAISVFIVTISPSHTILKVLTPIYSSFLLIVAINIFLLIYKNPKVVEVFSITYMIIIVISTIILNLVGDIFITSLNTGILVFFMGFTYKLIQAFVDLRVEYNMLHIKATTDSLTGAYNREYLELVKPHKHDICVFIDIDKFKEFNDLHGHSSGDQLLVDFVQLVNENICANCDIIRYGGDEFIVYMSGVNELYAKSKVEEMKRVLTTKYSDISFSYGLSKIGNDVYGAIEHADMKMYLMKKNKVTDSGIKVKE